MRRKYLLVCSVLTFVISLKSEAQNQLSGYIRDSISGAPLSGATIYIPDLKIGSSSNASGFYSIKNLPAGTVLVEVSNISYQNQITQINIAANTIKNFSIYHTTMPLKEVLLTGSSQAVEQRKNPLPSSILNHQDLLRNQSTNIIDAIQIIPGVSQISEGAAISKPVIRGLGYNRVLVINDGIRQEGQQWGDEFGIELDEYSVDRVEVLRGPSSLSYGSDAMAGVINFIGPASLPEGVIKANALVNYQTNNGLYATSLNFAGNKKNYIWDLRYSHKTAHDYKNKYDGYVWNSAFKEDDIKGIFGVNRKWGYSHLIVSVFDLKLGIIEGARDSATGNFTMHNRDSDNQDSLSIAPPQLYTKYNYFPIIHQHVRHYKAVLDNNFSVGSGSLAVKLAIQQNFRQEANDITKGDIYNNYFYLRTINYDAHYNLKEKNHVDLSFGVNGMAQSSRDRGIVFLVPEYNSFDAGVFGIARKSVGKLSLSGGLRFDSRSLRTKDLFIDSNTMRLKNPAPGSIQRFTSFTSNFSGLSGSLGATYDFTNKFYGKLNISRGFRAPSITESGSDGIHDGTPFYEIGDPNLKAEHSLQFDVTLGINTEDLSLEVNGFRNQINNYIFPVKLASVFGGDSIRNDFAAGFGGPTFKYIAGNALLSGGEIVLNIHPKNASWFRFENSFSLLNSIQTGQPDSTKYLPYTPPQKFITAITFNSKKINPTFRNAYLKLELQDYFKQDKIYYKFGNETVTPGYMLLNASLGTEIYIHNKPCLSLFLSGNNLTDVAYQSNMSRIKYTDTNNITGRVGVFNMGRNLSLKIIIPII